MKLFNTLFTIITLLCILMLCSISGIKAQPIQLQANDIDTLLPTYNQYNEYTDYLGNFNGVGHSNIFKIAKKGGKYYTVGDFTHIAANHGSALIVDTATNTVITPQKWRINGKINTAIPDGVGGYYIGGDFTKIGDSTRKYLARIDATGQPTNWLPKPDSFINKLIKRNDTLFIGGAYKKIFGATRYSLAMYSTTTNMLLGASNNTPQKLTGINDMFLIKDTLVLGGTSDDEDVYPVINKYNIKTQLRITFSLQIVQYGIIRSMQLSQDSSILIYNYYSNGNFIRGVNFKTGTIVYEVKVYDPSYLGGRNGIAQIKTVGNTTYAVGAFKGIIGSDGNIFLRKGFVGFNTYTGLVTAANIQADGFIHFIEKMGNQLIISGKFTEVQGQARNNMAVLDTGTLALLPWSLSPTDMVTALCSYNGKIFVAGEFTGLFAQSRKGFAAIDATTNTITPWNPLPHSFIAAKRMFIVGDTLFLLGIKNYANGNYVAELKLYSITTGAEYALPSMNYSKIRDCVVEGNYLYVSADRKLRRYALPGLPLDINWGTDWTSSIPTQNVHDPVHIIIDSTKIYTVGDTRFEFVATNFSPKRGYIASYQKATGVANYITYYEDTLPLYNQVFFEAATLADNKLYVAGYFTQLNGQPKKNFLCVQASNGNVLNFQTNFTDPSSSQSRFNTARSLLVQDGKLWFASNSSIVLGNTFFGGFGAIDTSNGVLQLPSIVTLKESYNTVSGVSDYWLSNNELVIVGDFDSANAVPKCGIVRYKLVPQYSSTYTFVGNGNWDDATNWQGNLIPPVTITTNILITINPIPNGECVLSRLQQIPAGSAILLNQNKKLKITGNLKIDVQ